MDGEEALFDLRELREDKIRKKPETAAAKRLGEIRSMEEADFTNLRRKLERGKPLTGAEARRLEDYRRRYEGLAGENLPEHIARNYEEVAAHFGRTKRSIVNWGKKGMPALPSGYYDLEAIAQWAFREGLIPEIPGASSSPDPEAGGLGKAHYEIELRRLQAELKRIELDKEMGKLIPLEEVEAGRVARVMAIKRGLLAVPRAMAPQLVGLEAREIEALLQEKVRELIGRFAGGSDDGN